jgi:hypothetical protein
MIDGSKLPKMLGILGVLLAGAGLATALPSAAQARGFVSIGIGVPLVPGPAYYYPPPPVVAYPPPAPVYYAPAPVYYAPAPVYAPPPATAYPSPPVEPQGECREYQSTTTIAGQPQSMVGTACRQPEGTWRIVN